MKKLTTVITALAVIVAGTCFLRAPLASAASDAPADVSITMSPTSARLELYAGQEIDGKFKIINTGRKDFKFRVYATPFSVNDKYEAEFVTKTDSDQKTVNRTQMARWISFPQTEFDLAEDKSVEVAYHVKVPDSIPDGGQYAAIFAQTIDDSAPGINATKRVGMLIYARTPGHTLEKGEVVSREIPGWISGTDNKIATKLTVKNSGNTDFNIDTQLVVDNFFGGNAFTSDVKTTNLLPDTSREIVGVDWAQEKDADGRIVKHGPPFIGLFWVTQKTTLFGNVESVRKLVLIFPAWLVAVIILAILCLVAFVIYRRQKKVKRGTHHGIKK